MKKVPSGTHDGTQRDHFKGRWSSMEPLVRFRGNVDRMVKQEACPSFPTCGSVEARNKYDGLAHSHFLNARSPRFKASTQVCDAFFASQGNCKPCGFVFVLRRPFLQKKPISSHPFGGSVVKLRFTKYDSVFLWVVFRGLFSR